MNKAISELEAHGTLAILVQRTLITLNVIGIEWGCAENFLESSKTILHIDKSTPCDALNYLEDLSAHLSLFCIAGYAAQGHIQSFAKIDGVDKVEFVIHGEIKKSIDKKD